MKNLLIIILFLSVFFNQSCKNEDATSEIVKSSITSKQTIENFPKLLDRNEKIQLGKEWENVQNYYGTYRKQIMELAGNKEALLGLAQLFVQEARVTGEHGHYYPASIKLIEALLAIPQKDDAKDNDLVFRALSTKAGVQLSLHDFAEALETGKKAIEMNPHNAQIYGVLVDAYVEMGDYDKAVEMADKMVSIRPDLRSYSRVSYLREIHGDIEGAIEVMNMAVSAGFPGYEQTAWARLTLGELYKEYGEEEKAEREFQIILQTRADYPFAIAALASIEMERGNYDLAEAKLKEACEIIPEFGFYVQLADLYQKTDRKEEAEKLLEEIKLMLQDDIDHGHNMSMEYANLYLEFFGNGEKALEYALSEYEKRPKNNDVNGLLARIYFHENDLEQAKKHLKIALQTGAQKPALLALVVGQK